jgi:hypothetical protein
MHGLRHRTAWTGTRTAPAVTSTTTCLGRRACTGWSTPRMPAEQYKRRDCQHDNDQSDVPGTMRFAGGGRTRCAVCRTDRVGLARFVFWMLLLFAIGSR